MNKKLRSIGLATFLVMALVSIAKADVFFDIDVGGEYYDAVSYVKTEGIVQGYEDGTYKPNNTINRAEFTKIIVEATFSSEDIESCNTSRFPDVPTGEWFAPYICVAQNNSVIGGYPDGTYQPANNINFVEAAKIISIAFGEGESNSEVWYEDYVRFLEGEDAIPMSIASFEHLITRGEMAEMIYRIDASVQGKASRSYEDLQGAVVLCATDQCTPTPSSLGECISEGCNEVTITTDENYRYIMANNIPNHETGDFPNSGNPNTISEQDYDYRMPLNPVYKSAATSVQMPGVSLNGVFFEPGTAERNGEWSYEAFQNELNLGLDDSNAHVQPTGAYHYHGQPEGLIETIAADGDLVQVGWAADGHPMYISNSEKYASSYKLKTGTRSDIGGSYDGTYTQDFEYVEGLGDLDDCNGMWIGDEYVYLLTETFPYISRCLHGTPDDSFSKGGGGAGPTAGTQPGGQSGPPQGAIDSCSGKDNGMSCSFTDGPNSISGTCGDSPDGLVCKP